MHLGLKKPNGFIKKTGSGYLESGESSGEAARWRQGPARSARGGGADGGSGGGTDGGGGSGRPARRRRRAGG